jgi:hypothetical protein
MRLMLGPSGSIDGAVVARGRPLLFAGTARGSTMQIALTARDGLQMRGAGTATSPIRSCADVPHGGSLSGPRKADTGDWALAELSREASRYEAERASASKAERSEKLTAERIAE